MDGDSACLSRGQKPFPRFSIIAIKVLEINKSFLYKKNTNTLSLFVLYFDECNNQLQILH